MGGKARLILILSTIIGLVILFSQCMETNNSNDLLLPSDTAFAGSTACIQCHKDIYNSFQDNAHALSSREIPGYDLFAGNNAHSKVYEFDQYLKITVEKRDSGMYQAIYIEGQEEFAKRFDVAIGSGKNAITYASWTNNLLKQLQLSYFSKMNVWANSPGYPDKKIYARNIQMRCLECHASHAAPKTRQVSTANFSDELLKSSIQYGINCERCHGPAARHVEFQKNNPAEKTSKYIAKYQELTSKQKSDACAICHAGDDMYALKSTFGFKPGEDLADYFDRHSDISNPDVHGQQNKMLEGSMCFIKSKDLSCNSCHTIHKPKNIGLTAYSKKCVSCHAEPKHSAQTLKNAQVKTNCIDCHMPLQASKVISYKMASEKEVSPYFLRTHKIGVY